jgi:hypothetical protein
MAALLDFVHLRRHELSAHFMAGLDRRIDRRAAPGSYPISGDRPRLTAIWRVGAAGRPACAWHIESAAPDIPSG